jgi:hypothetical protein
VRIPKNEFVEHGLLATDLAGEDLFAAPTILHSGISSATAVQRHVLLVHEIGNGCS